MEFDFGKIIDFGVLGWAKQEGIWKYFAAIFIFTAVMTFATYFMTSSMLGPLTTLHNASTLDAINAMFHYFSFIGILVIVSFLVTAAFTYLLIAKALDAKGKNFVEFGATRWLLFVILEIANCIFAVLSIFKLKMLLVGIAGVVLLIVSVVLFSLSGFGNMLYSIAGAILLLIGLLLLMAYFVMIIYNYLRLSVSNAVFVEKEMGIVESMRSSWALTGGKVLNILVALIILGIISGIISMILAGPLIFYNIFSAITAGGVLNPKNLIDPVFLLLNILSVAGSTLMSIIWAFGLVGIYGQVKGGAKVAVPKKPFAAKRSLKKK